MARGGNDSTPRWLRLILAIRSASRRLEVLRADLVDDRDAELREDRLRRVHEVREVPSVVLHRIEAVVGADLTAGQPRPFAHVIERGPVKTSAVRTNHGLFE